MKFFKFTWSNTVGKVATIILAGVLIFLAIGVAANATDGYDCNSYRNHSGNVPDRYDVAFFYERDYGWFGPIAVPEGGLEYPPPQGRRSWDKVKKCNAPPPTTTTTLPPSTTTTTEPPPTTTVPPSTTTTTVAPPTTTTSIPPETTTTTQPEVTTTTSPPETTTTTAPPVTTTTVPCEEEGTCLPNTGFPLSVWAGVGALLVLLGSALRRLAA